MPEKLDEAIDRAFADVANVRMFGRETSDGASARSVACWGVGGGRVEGTQRECVSERGGGLGHCCLRSLRCNGRDLKLEGGKVANWASEVKAAETQSGLIAMPRAQGEITTT